MQHPKSENILKVIQNFEKVLPMAKMEGNLNMDEGGLKTHSSCGSVCCHGGWYMVASEPLKRRGIGFWQFGANEMASHLGFENYNDIKQWAADNKEIWGNREGFAMFIYSKAFSSPSRPYGAKTLQDIVDHWKEVYERVKALEEKESPKTSQPSRENITKKLAVDSVEERIDVLGEIVNQ